MATSKPKNSIGKLTLLYQAPIVKALKPKHLKGPFYIDDAAAIRKAFEKRIRNDQQRKKDDILISHQFYRDLNVDKYLSKKSNWNESRFISTMSFCSALDTYLPKYTQTTRLLSSRPQLKQRQLK